MSSALKALSSARKLMQNAWISISSIQLIPSMILPKLCGSCGVRQVRITRLWEGGGGGVAKQFSTFSFQHGACRNKMSGIFKRCTAELAGWVTMRLPITPHAKSGGVRL